MAARTKRAAACAPEAIAGPWSLPDGWRWERLGELGNWYGGGTPSKSESAYWEGGTIPWVSPKDMKAAYILDSIDHITEAALRSSAAKRIPSGSVLCVMRSGILRHTFPVAVTRAEVTLNQDLRALTPRKDISADYLAHYLRAIGRKVLDECSKDGTTVNSIEAGRLAEQFVPLPNLSIQQKIAARIDLLFEEIEEGERALAEAREGLNTYRASLLNAAVTGRLTEAWRAEHPAKTTGKDLLNRLLSQRRAKWDDYSRNAGKRYQPPPEPKAAPSFSLPRGWEWVTLGQLSIIDSGQTPRGIEEAARPSGEIPWFKVSSMTQIGNETELKHSNWWITESQANDLRLTLFDAGSIIFPKLGGALLTNKRRILAQKSGIDLNNMAITPMPDTARYVWHILSGINFSDYSDGSVVPQLKKTTVEAISIGLPPERELRHICNLLDRWDAEFGDEIDGLGSQALMLRQAVLTAAFRGNLSNE